MAPVDLLLQRLGRLWRHDRPARPADVARLVLLCGTEADGLPRFPDFTDAIYDRYVLLRSCLALDGKARIGLPGDIEPLVQAVYDDPEPEPLSEVWRRALENAKAKQEAKQDEDAALAGRNAIAEPGRGLGALLKPGSTRDSPVQLDLREDDDPTTHPTVQAVTRLGRPSVSVVCAGSDLEGNPLATVTAGKPTLKDARQMIGFSLALSHPQLFQTLVAKPPEPPPPAWHESRYLRHHRLLTFEHGETQVSGYTLRLGRDKGLEIKSNADGKTDGGD